MQIDLQKYAPLGGNFPSSLDLTLYVACYNEVDNLASTLNTLRAALAQVDITNEIIIIDDCSTDGTVQVAVDYIESHPDEAVFLVVNKFNTGLGQNFINGAFHGRGTYYRLICGDDVEPAETFVKLFSRLGEADMIIPYHVACPGRSAFRVALSLTYTKIVNAISGYRLKYYNGMTIHRRYDVMRWHTNYHGFGFQADMITRLLDEGASYLEVPITGRERQSGGSKALTFRNCCSVAHFLLDLMIRRVGRILFKRGVKITEQSPV